MVNLLFGSCHTSLGIMSTVGENWIVAKQFSRRSSGVDGLWTKKNPHRVTDEDFLL